KAGSIHCSV
ncbi:hypothetical protein CISIN_1g0260301mg, partial [Citrus sinensis]